MKKLREIGAFFIYSNLFISACALALTAETFFFLHLPQYLNWYLAFVPAGTLFVYGLHYLAKGRGSKEDERLQWTRKHRKALTILVVAGAGMSVFLVVQYLLPESRNRGLVLPAFLLTGALALLYSHQLIPGAGRSIRHLGGLKLLLLSGVWTVATLALPLWLWMLENDPPFTATQLTGFVLHRFVFIALVAFLFNLYDHEEDRQDGIRTIVVMAGPERSRRTGQWIALGLNLLMAAWLWRLFPYQGLYYPIALFLPVVLLFLLYRYFRADIPEAGFVLSHDGLLLLKALLLIFAVGTGNG